MLTSTVDSLYAKERNRPPSFPHWEPRSVNGRMLQESIVSHVIARPWLTLWRECYVSTLSEFKVIDDLNTNGALSPCSNYASESSQLRFDDAGGPSLRGYEGVVIWCCWRPFSSCSSVPLDRVAWWSPCCAADSTPPPDSVSRCVPPQWPAAEAGRWGPTAV